MRTTQVCYCDARRHPDRRGPARAVPRQVRAGAQRRAGLRRGQNAGHSSHHDEDSTGRWPSAARSACRWRSAPWTTPPRSRPPRPCSTWRSAEALHKFHRGIEVDDETMCLDLIAEMEFGAAADLLGHRPHAATFPPDRLAAAALRSPLLRPRGRGDPRRRKAPASRRPGLAQAGGGAAGAGTAPALSAELDRIVAAARNELLA